MAWRSAVLTNTGRGYQHITTAAAGRLHVTCVYNLFSIVFMTSRCDGLRMRMHEALA
jgi:hypothetical protein